MCVLSGTVPVLISESCILINKVCAELKIMLFYQHLVATVWRPKFTSTPGAHGYLLLVFFSGSEATTRSSGVPTAKF